MHWRRTSPPPRAERSATRRGAVPGVSPPPSSYWSRPANWPRDSELGRGPAKTSAPSSAGRRTPHGTADGGPRCASRSRSSPRRRASPGRRPWSPTPGTPSLPSQPSRSDAADAARRRAAHRRSPVPGRRPRRPHHLLAAMMLRSTVAAWAAPACSRRWSSASPRSASARPRRTPPRRLVADGPAVGRVVGRSTTSTPSAPRAWLPRVTAATSASPATAAVPGASSCPAGLEAAVFTAIAVDTSGRGVVASGGLLLVTDDWASTVENAVLQSGRSPERRSTTSRCAAPLAVAVGDDGVIMSSGDARRHMAQAGVTDRQRHHLRRDRRRRHCRRRLRGRRDPRRRRRRMDARSYGRRTRDLRRGLHRPCVGRRPARPLRGHRQRRARQRRRADVRVLARPAGPELPAVAVSGLGRRTRSAPCSSPAPRTPASSSRSARALAARLRPD